jgi:hypothetical protein
MLNVMARRWRVRVEWKLADLWIGAFWKDSGNTTFDLWVCLIPCLPIHVKTWLSCPTCKTSTWIEAQKKFCYRCSLTNECRCSCHDPNDPMRSILPSPCCDKMQSTEQVIAKVKKDTV